MGLSKQGQQKVAIKAATATTTTVDTDEVKNAFRESLKRVKCSRKVVCELAYIFVGVVRYAPSFPLYTIDYGTKEFERQKYERKTTTTTATTHDELSHVNLLIPRPVHIRNAFPLYIYYSRQICIRYSWISRRQQHQQPQQTNRIQIDFEGLHFGERFTLGPNQASKREL